MFRSARRRPEGVAALLRATITRHFNAISIARDDGGPLPRSVYKQFLGDMTYNHVTHLRGRAAYVNNVHNPVKIETRRQYDFDSKGVLCCGAGFRDRVYSKLKKLGYAVEMQEATPRTRPEALEVSRENLDRIFLSKITLRHRQDEFLDKALDRISRGLGGCIQAVAGYGKSCLTVGLAAALPRARIAVTVPGAEVCRKTVAELSQYFPNIGLVGDGSKEYRRVTVYSMQSLHLMHEDTDVIIVDEAHRFLSDKTAAVLGSVTRNAVPFALSATLGDRIDGADARLEEMFGPIIFHIGWVEAMAHNVVVPINVIWHVVRSCPYDLEQFRGNPTAMARWGIWRNDDRNRVIAKVAETIPDDEQRLVFVATTDHAAHLSKLLPEYELCYGTYDEEKFAKYVAAGLIKKKHVRLDRKGRKILRDGFMSGAIKKVIATDVWATGMSFNSLAHLIRADARSSAILAEQLPARTSRIDGRKTHAAVHDFYDMFHGFERKSRDRKKEYADKSWLQTWAKGKPPTAGVGR